MNKNEQPKIEALTPEAQPTISEGPKIYLSNGAKRRIIKEMFNNNEGKHKLLEAAEVEDFIKIYQELAKISETQEQDFQDYSDDQKSETLKNTLFALAEKINPKISVSQNQIEAYIRRKRVKLLGSFAKLQHALDFINHLDNSGIFAYRLRTSGYEIEKTSQENLEDKENIAPYLNNLFSQSVYYVTPSGMTIRLKLSEIKSPRTKVRDILQIPMEQIFFNNKEVDCRDKNNNHKKVVKLSDTLPGEGKYVFEILTEQFQKLLQSEDNNSNREYIESGVEVIHEKEGFYVNVPEKSILHSGWKIVGIDKF